MMGVVFDRRGPSGNIYAVLGKASRALELKGRNFDAMRMRTQVYDSGSYEDALLIIAEYVDLIDMTEERGL